VVVTGAYRSAYPHPIAFEPGDRLQVGGRSEEFRGWIWVRTADGNEGWAPEPYLTLNAALTEATARRSYNARELDTVVAEVLTVTVQLNQWYWATNADGQSGWVPASTVSAI
jgi:hypothetical protein